MSHHLYLFSAVSCILGVKILFFVADKIFQMTVFGEFQQNSVQGSELEQKNGIG